MDHASVIDRLGVAVLDAGIPDVGRFAIYKWRERSSIPSKYWPAVIRIAEQAKEPGITLDALMNGQSAPTPAPVAEPDEARA